MSSDTKMAEVIRRSVEAGAHDLSAASWLPYMRTTWWEGWRWTWFNPAPAVPLDQQRTP